MTTQTGLLQLVGPQGSHYFSSTVTDDAWKNTLDKVATSSHLGEVMEGKVITHFKGQYAAGAGVWRIRNRVTNEIIAVGPCEIIKGEHLHPLEKPLTVSRDWTVDIFTVATPT